MTTAEGGRESILKIGETKRGSGDSESGREKNKVLSTKMAVRQRQTEIEQQQQRSTTHVIHESWR
jgi:hypothetical protein